MVNLYSKYPAVMLLTGLRDDWQLFLFEVGQVVDCVFGLKRGISMLETFINQPYPNQPEVDELERILRRPKLNMMDLLPQSDVADMHDMFDVMTLEEIQELQLTHLLEFLKQTPAFQQ